MATQVEINDQLNLLRNITDNPTLEVQHAGGKIKFLFETDAEGREHAVTPLGTTAGQILAKLSALVEAHYTLRKINRWDD